MNRRYVLSAAAAAVLAAGAALTGCSSGFAPEGGGSSSAPSTSVPPSVVTDYPPSPSESVPDAPAVVMLGETYTYPDGLQLMVESLPDGVIPESYGFVSPAVGTPYPVFRYTITNGTSVPFDPALASQTINYGPAGTAPGQVYGVGDGMDYWQGAILPGQSQSLEIPYDMPVGQDVTITFAPSFEHMPAIFTNMPDPSPAP